MTVKEFLLQECQLKARIRSCRDEIKELEELVRSVSSPGFGEHNNPNPNTSSPFERSLMKIYDMQKKLDRMISALMDYKRQVKSLLRSIPDRMDRYIMEEHYLHHRSFAEIAEDYDVNRSTIKRRHDRVIEELELPEDAVDIGKLWDYDIY